jgi:hypothetical protein
MMTESATSMAGFYRECATFLKVNCQLRLSTLELSLKDLQDHRRPGARGRRLSKSSALLSGVVKQAAADPGN